MGRDAREFGAILAFIWLGASGAISLLIYYGAVPLEYPLNLSVLGYANLVCAALLLWAITGRGGR